MIQYSVSQRWSLNCIIQYSEVITKLYNTVFCILYHFVFLDNFRKTQITSRRWILWLWAGRAGGRSWPRLRSQPRCQPRCHPRCQPPRQWPGPGSGPRRSQYSTWPWRQWWSTCPSYHRSDAWPSYHRSDTCLRYHRSDTCRRHLTVDTRLAGQSSELWNRLWILAPDPGCVALTVIASAISLRAALTGRPRWRWHFLESPN